MNAVSGQLARIYADTTKFGNEKFMDLSTLPVRYEPFVIWIEGSSRAGSFVTEQIAKELLADIEFNNPSSESIIIM